MNIAELLHDNVNIQLPQSYKYILAVSGGKDSMAMLHLCIKQNLNIVVAHCNFMLREEDSMADEVFVSNYCQLNNITFEAIQFNTKQACETLGKSTQETARILRYDWFDKLKEKHQADYIITAHHANDVAETFLHNIARGSGLNGMISIPKKNGDILRPLLTITSAKIQDYIAQHNIAFRDDVSNQSDNYTRNFIRHKIIPKLEEVNNNAIEHILGSTHVLAEVKFIVDEKIAELKSKFITENNDKLHIDISVIKTLPYYGYILYDWLTPFGFNSSQILNIQQGENVSGNNWITETHISLLNRDEIIIKPIVKSEKNILVFDVGFPEKFYHNNYCFETTILSEKPAKYQPNFLYFDFDKITFPVTIRNWKEGDYFNPLGMSNSKKLSDFFIDEKVDQFTKHLLPIICDVKYIIAVAPLRINDTYKITSNTKNILCLKISNKISA